MPDSEALDTVEHETPQHHDSSPPSMISVSALTDRVQKVRNARDEVMEEDIHYGVIPGTGDKPSLKKPGAELLLGLFNLDPEPNIEIKDLGNGHREYIVTGPVYHIPTGNRVGSGFGSCSTKESKYRYRKEEKVTDIKPPQAFWDSYDKDRGENMGDADFSILREHLNAARKNDPIPTDADVGVEFVDNSPRISYETGRKENPDIADCYNTCGKMAKKRWMVDVALTATHASELFTQDVEDLKDLDGVNVGGSKKQKSSGKEKRGPRSGSGAASKPNNPGRTPTSSPAQTQSEAPNGNGLVEAVNNIPNELRSHAMQAGQAMPEEERDAFVILLQTKEGTELEQIVQEHHQEYC